MIDCNLLMILVIIALVIIYSLHPMNQISYKYPKN